MISISSLKLNDGTHGLPKNPRLIKDERFAALCESVKNNPEYMPARPIVVDENNVILGGNMRWRACNELGMKEIPNEWVKRVCYVWDSRRIDFYNDALKLYANDNTKESGRFDRLLFRVWNVR